MSNKKMREEFEVWAVSNGYELDVSDDARFTYDFHETECAWYGWQASRAALCVELPSKINDQSDKWSNGHDFGIDDAQDALDAAGVSYK